MRGTTGTYAMYGGVRENFVEEIIERGCMSRSSRFLDVGSGIGQVTPTATSRCCVPQLPPVATSFS